MGNTIANDSTTHRLDLNKEVDKYDQATLIKYVLEKFRET